MKSKLIRKDLKYTGKELQSQWAYKNHGLAGDSIVAFMGPCEVPLDNMLDIEDVRNNSPIYSKKMLHFIIEHFEMGIECAILRQRLLTSIIVEIINEGKKGNRVERHGDDIFLGDRKLSVSIAALTPVSAMIHFGININAKDAPVKATDLKTLGIEPLALAQKTISAYRSENNGINFARVKVRPAP